MKLSPAMEAALRQVGAPGGCPRQQLIMRTRKALLARGLIFESVGRLYLTYEGLKAWDTLPRWGQ